MPPIGDVIRPRRTPPVPAQTAKQNRAEKSWIAKAAGMGERRSCGQPPRALRAYCILQYHRRVGRSSSADLRLQQWQTQTRGRGPRLPRQRRKTFARRLEIHAARNSGGRERRAAAAAAASVRCLVDCVLSCAQRSDCNSGPCVCTDLCEGGWAQGPSEGNAGDARCRGWRCVPTRACKDDSPPCRVCCTELLRGRCAHGIHHSICVFDSIDMGNTHTGACCPRAIAVIGVWVVLCGGCCRIDATQTISGLDRGC